MSASWQRNLNHYITQLTLKNEQLRAALKNILGNAAMSEQYAGAYLVDAGDIELARLALEEKDCPELQTPPADHRRRAA
jgi:hypothetical protein